MLTRYLTGRVTQTSAQHHAGSAWHLLRHCLLVILLMLSVGIPAMSPAHAHTAEPTLSKSLRLQRGVPKPSFAACPKGVPPHARCGTVNVPLDSAHPAAGTLPIAFELYRHTRTTQPAHGTIVPSIGGPGISDTAVNRLFLRLFRPLLDRWDLLLIDHRGIGRSAAINCPAIQHLKGDFLSGVRACGTKLGAAADRYGSGDVADDVDTVRAALGIDKIDYVGSSYGAVDVGAYALRHPDHLRSAVLDSPWISSDDTFVSFLPPWAAKVEALVCRRSPSCAAANPDPAGTLAWLAQDLRAHPFNGTGYVQVGDTSCARNPNATFHNPFGALARSLVTLRGVARFPRIASQALPARVDPAASDRSTRADRQVASVVWSAVDDAFFRAIRMRGKKGRGLRGGSFTVRRTNAAIIITYRKSRFSDDVGVSGTATFNRVTNALDAHVSVEVRGSQGGALSFHGILFDPMQPTVQVRGQIGKRSIALLTLAN